MPTSLFRSSVVTQALLMAGASFLFLYFGVLPTINIVVNTYGVAGTRALSGLSPYVPPPVGSALDQYKYSPLFALAFGALIQLSKHFGIESWLATLYLWTLLNAISFWLGVCRWLDLRQERPAWFLVALAACFVELDTSLWYCQTNALLVGITLFALAEFRDGRPICCGLLLALGSDLKVLPLLFAGALVLGGVRRYRVALMGGAIASFLLPCSILGWTKNLIFHRQWLGVLFHDCFADGKLDLASVLAGYHWPVAGLLLRSLVLLVTLALLGEAAWRRDLAFPRWIALGLCALLLVSPRTEQPTFVLAGPAFLLLASRSASRVETSAILFVCVLVSLRSWRGVDPSLSHGEYKTLGTFLLWAIAAGHLAWRSRRRAGKGRLLCPSISMRKGC